MIEHFLQYVMPAAYALLPPEMQSPAATALLAAIGLQESGFRQRRQLGGPARGFLMFERAGVRAILTHPRSAPHLLSATKALCYAPTLERISSVIEHNDTLAAVCARLLLWTLPGALPSREDQAVSFGQYLAAWNPGTARDPERLRLAQDRWGPNFTAAWELVDSRPPS